MQAALRYECKPVAFVRISMLSFAKFKATFDYKACKEEICCSGLVTLMAGYKEKTSAQQDESPRQQLLIPARKNTLGITIVR